MHYPGSTPRRGKAKVMTVCAQLADLDRVSDAVQIVANGPKGGTYEMAFESREAVALIAKLTQEVEKLGASTGYTHPAYSDLVRYRMAQVI